MLTPDQVISLVREQATYTAYNHELIDIYEGCLMPYIEKALYEQFSLQVYQQAKHRMVPINILPKIIDKLSNIYGSGAVIRQVIDGDQQDKDLLSWYQDKMKPNNLMQCANEMFNLCRTALIQPYAYGSYPYLRVILNDQFVVYSEDRVNTCHPTHIIIFRGKNQNGEDLYEVYSDTEFMICNSKGDIEHALMAEVSNPEGVNPFGKIPFIYINESKYRLRPKQEQDIAKLTKVIPVMLTDLNLAAMYQSFSIMYGIDLDDEGLKMAPNAFWKFKSDPTTDKKPEIGMLKPQVDYDQVLNLIQSELSMWLGTKGIKASGIDGLSKDTLASGISKIIDEMDTFEARQKQISYFEQAETDLWDLVLKYMHPVWSRSGEIENRAQFSPTASVAVAFPLQLPMQSRGQLVKDAKEEYAAGFTSRKRALMRLNPELTGEEIDELIQEIDDERTINQPEEPVNAGQMAEDRPQDSAGSQALAESGVSGSSD